MFCNSLIGTKTNVESYSLILLSYKSTTVRELVVLSS